MRKISKSRTKDDDMASSADGSVYCDETEVNDNKNSDEDANKEDSEDDISDDSQSKKNKSSKKKSKKRKLEKESNEDEYEVEKIIDVKKIKGKILYLVRWKGYSSESDSWEPEETVSCSELIDNFNEQRQSGKDKEKDSSVKKSSKKKSKKKENKVSPKKKTKTEWDTEKADKNAEYEVERILEVHFKKNGDREFLIHWKGWSNKFDSWEPEAHLNCTDLINKFMEKVETARKAESRSLRVNPETTNRFTLQMSSSGRRLSKRNSQAQRVRYDNAE